MLKEQALVVDYQKGIAIVKCQSKTACGSCMAKNSCGTAALSQLTSSSVGEHLFQISSPMPLKIGQLVEIGLTERALLISAFLLYLVPLLVLVTTTFLSSFLFQHELISAIFILFCTALSFFIIRFYTAKTQKKSAFQPILLRTLN